MALLVLPLLGCSQESSPTTPDTDPDARPAPACDLGRAPQEDDPEVAADPVLFDVVDDTAVMTGTIGVDFPHRLCDLAGADPEVTTIEVADVPGSSTPGFEVLDGGRVARALGYTTIVPGDGQVESGGVDFFLAGAERIIEDAACLGVHSGDVDGVSLADLPRDDPEHDAYLDYFADMGIDEEFYWFTLEAAPPEGIHYLTPDEIERFGLVTGTPPTVDCPLPDDG